MPQTIEAEEQNLLYIFNDAYDFIIPPYQRPYAWTIEQTSALLDDLKQAAAYGNEDIEKMPPYFLGSIVVIKEKGKALSEIIDGQQRLTTLTILFCVLREIEGDADAKNDLDKYVIAQGNRVAHIASKPRLQLRERDKKFFSDKVQAKGQLEKFLHASQNEKLPHSRKRIFENAKYLWTELSKFDRSKRQRLAEFLVLRCYLVVVSSSDLDSAYRVFAVMNDRGLNLSATDILKAKIIGELPETHRASYTQKWEGIEEELGRENFANLFAHIRMIYTKRKQGANLQQEFHAEVLSKLNSDKNFIDHVLVPYSESYHRILIRYESAGSAYEIIERYLAHLRRLDNFDWVPPAIAFFAHHKGDSDKVRQFTIDLERLAYALFVRRATVNERIRRYAEILHAIEKKENLYANTAPLQLKPEEKKEVREALNRAIYHERFCTPLLLRLDSLLAGQGATYKDTIVSVEHVLPQSPGLGSEWLKSFPDQVDRENWTHRLANLVLLSRRKNAKAQNYDFARKKKEYFLTEDGVSPFALTTKVLEESQWTQDVLEKRQQELFKKLTTEWRL